MADAISDPGDLGLGDEDLGTLLLAPMVAVAWADGRCDRREIEAIVDSYDVQSDDSVLRLTPTGRRFLHDKLLGERPDTEMLSSMIRLLAMHIDRQAVNVADRSRDIIARLCLDVAKASGGFGGLFDRISNAEKEMLRSIMRELDLRRAPVARDMLRAAGL